MSPVRHLSLSASRLYRNGRYARRFAICKDVAATLWVFVGAMNGVVLLHALALKQWLLQRPVHVTNFLIPRKVSLRVYSCLQVGRGVKSIREVIANSLFTFMSGGR